MILNFHKLLLYRLEKKRHSNVRLELSILLLSSVSANSPITFSFKKTASPSINTLLTLIILENALTFILYGVPQGSILGPLFFNIFLCDLFLAVPDIDIVSYADDNTGYSLGVSVDEV